MKCDVQDVHEAFVQPVLTIPDIRLRPTTDPLSWMPVPVGFSFGLSCSHFEERYGCTAAGN